jgi:hypothetical protein
LFFCSVQFDGAAIFERGCLHAAEDWLERNLIMVAVFATATCFSQVSPSSLNLLDFTFFNNNNSK